jgi:hypothetical protein
MVLPTFGKYCAAELIVFDRFLLIAGMPIRSTIPIRMPPAR